MDTIMEEPGARPKRSHADHLDPEENQGTKSSVVCKHSKSKKSVSFREDTNLTEDKDAPPAISEFVTPTEDMTHTEYKEAADAPTEDITHTQYEEAEDA